MPRRRADSVFSALKETAFRAKASMQGAFGQVHFDTKHDYKHTVFLAGSARGGTTWIAELINFDNSYRFIFEPLHVNKVPLTKPFGWRKYLRPEDDSSRFLDPMSAIVSGRFRNAWSDRYNRQRIGHQRLIKEVRANLLLGWLYKQFPKMPLILLLRHPCAVISSRLRHHWDGYNVRMFLKQEDLMADFLAPFRRAMENAETPFEHHLYHWCVETFVPFRQFKPDEIHIAFYESFCTQPRQEIGRLFSFLGKPLDERIFTSLKKPSSQSYRKDNGATSDLIAGWRHDLSSQQIQKTMEVVSAFGLGSLYGEDGMPNIDGANALLHSP